MAELGRAALLVALGLVVYAAVAGGWAAHKRLRRLAVSALLGMVNHTPQWFRPRGRLGPEEIAAGYVDLILGRSSGRDR